MHHQVAIIGAGFGGLGMGIRLKKSGNTSFIIFEKAAELGGTWRENRYPGCACDVPANLYSFSFAQNPNWSRKYARQEEILAYMKKTSQDFGMEEFIRYNSEVSEIKFIESAGHWEVKTKDGYACTAQIVVSATGPLSRPNMLNLKGKDSFKGDLFHTALWDSSFDPKGKRIAVVGTGASAIQAIPELAKDAKELYVFQRSAPWILPRPDRSFHGIEKWMNRNIPGFLALKRQLLYLRLESSVNGFLGKSLMNDLATWGANLHRKKSIKDPELRRKTTPNYKLGCKRVLVSSDYYPALQLPHVELLETPAAEIKEHSIIDKQGKEYEVDAILMATGFIASEIYLDMNIYGRAGQELIKSWEAEGPEAYYGLSVSGYPNLFFLLGPNTGLGHNSVVHMIESQVNYVLDYMKVLKARGLKFLDIKSQVQEAHNEEIQEKLKSTVWQSGGCQSWYQTSKGKNTTLWPGSTIKYRKITREVHPHAYQEVGQKEGAEKELIS
ncbi:MAG: NAD(P)/FAD-dependent oxidoreductase [Bacteroidota bacterium]